MTLLGRENKFMESEEKNSNPGASTSGETCLTELPPEPSVKPGCPACLSLSVARENARSTGNHSAVSDCNVKLRRHQEEALGS
jgi:hypothetical protein